MRVGDAVRCETGERGVGMSLREIREVDRVHSGRQGATESRHAVAPLAQDWRSRLTWDEGESKTR